MSIAITNLGCCGLKEISGISAPLRDPDTAVLRTRTPIENLKAFKVTLGKVARAYGLFEPEYSKFGAVIFSDTAPRLRQTAAPLADYIEAHDLGEVTRVDNILNRNTDNRLMMCVWVVNFKEWLKWTGDRKKDLAAPSTGPAGSLSESR